MSGTVAVKTMRLRYAGVCAGCSASLRQGETAHYRRTSRTVRCLPCGPGAEDAPVAVTAGSQHRNPSAVPREPADAELVRGEPSRASTCDDCGRRLQRGSEALGDAASTAILCIECVTLDTVHSLGIPGGGVRKEHDKRRQRHQTRVRTAHPKLGGLILALGDDPSHVRAWQIGAEGEEAFGRRLSEIASETIKVLHDRKVPGSSANIDHLAVTSGGVWVLDAKRYTGKVETRGHGLFSRRSPDLYVGGRNQMKLVEGVKRQAQVIRTVLEAFTAEHGVVEVPVRPALVFVGAEFGLFPSPFTVDGVWVGWGRAVRKRLAEETAGQLPAGKLAKRLARELRPG